MVFSIYSGGLRNLNNYALCTDIPLSEKLHIDGSSKRYIQWFFDNLLPEEGARTLLARDININEADSFGILSIVGAESAGAITLSSKSSIDKTTNNVVERYCQVNNISTCCAILCR
ncbi:HipA N-terminal domain-containing protein [Vibrio sp. 1-Bac 57]|uniref:HipA N-terminal domain-containing protein n=1 Tax=Psychromonas arctica TaxID=168275 RepID=UPI000413B30B|nr:HipA N-terminal domain-containing protein [Psychromonas arctica]